MTIQNQFNRYQQLGQVGQLARPNEPHIIDRGQAGVAVRPGDGVYYNAATNRWILPTDAATRLLVTGIVTYEQGTVQSAVSGGTPSGSNSDQEIVFPVDSSIRILTLGSIYLIAGDEYERDQNLEFDPGEGGRWVAAPTPTASLIASPRLPVTFIQGSQQTTVAAENDIIIARVGSLVR